MSAIKRVICIVLDGVGVGAAPDAAEYGDLGSNSLGHVAGAVGRLLMPSLERMGLGNVIEIAGVSPVSDPTACFGMMTPAAVGKDSTTGHWELMGLVLTDPFPTYPHGFPPDITDEFRSLVGRDVLGNRAASGTEIIRELGERHVESGALIVYTSQDSVFQIAAHEDVVPVEELYRICKIARGLLVHPHNVARVIARPFTGSRGSYYRTSARRDFSVAPMRPTVLDLLSDAGLATVTVGKIDDLFAGRGITRAIHSVDNSDGMAKTLELVRKKDASFVFTNLVDFDTMWGHRNDVRAYALGLEEFDSFLRDLLPALRADDLLMITSDHGNDPTGPGTDHTRENVPLLVYRPDTGRGRALGCLETLADVGATVCAALGAKAPAAGRSFLEKTA